MPARFASVYAPYVMPQDFYAAAEVFLAGTWHLVDATGMAALNQIVRISVGLDAAEVLYLSGFGPVMMIVQNASAQVVEQTRRFKGNPPCVRRFAGDTV